MPGPAKLLRPVGVSAAVEVVPHLTQIYGERGSHSLSAEGRKDNVNRPEGPPTGMSESVEL